MEVNKSMQKLLDKLDLEEVNRFISHIERGIELAKEIKEALLIEQLKKTKAKAKRKSG